MPTYILCADDFALSSAISGAIAELAIRGCINAISCMAAMPSWAEDARLLSGIGPDKGAHGGMLGGVQVGLHLVLAGETPLTPLSWRQSDGRMPDADRSMMLAYARRLDLEQLTREIDAQFAAFMGARGHPPDFVDAHQHVHVFPGLRACVLAAARRHAPGAWVRNPADRMTAMLRRPYAAKAIGSTIHAAGLGRALRRAGIASNDSFAGHYDYGRDEEEFGRLLPKFFRAAGQRHLIMCHPGAGRAPDDGIADARMVEAAVIGAMPLAERLRELRILS